MRHLYACACGQLYSGIDTATALREEAESPGALREWAWCRRCGARSSTYRVAGPDERMPDDMCTLSCVISDESELLPDDIWNQPPVGVGSVDHSATPILFLDYDGVLHPEFPRWGEAFQYVGVLADILTPHPSVRIVLATSWVLGDGGIERAARRLGDLGGRVIGAVHHVDGERRRLSRGQRILEDARRRGIPDNLWIAIDDDVEGWPEEAAGNLIAADGSSGLGDVKLQRRLREAVMRIVQPRPSKSASAPHLAEEELQRQAGVVDGLMGADEEPGRRN